MTYKILDISKSRLRGYIYLTIFLVSLLFLIAGVIFDILFLKIFALVCFFCIWLPAFYFKKEFAGTINFNETGIIISKEDSTELHLQYVDIQDIEMNYQGYHNDTQTIGNKVYFATGHNTVKITTKEKEYEIDFLVEHDYSKKKFKKYIQWLEENNIPHAIKLGKNSKLGDSKMTKRSMFLTFVVFFFVMIIFLVLTGRKNHFPESWDDICSNFSPIIIIISLIGAAIFTAWGYMRNYNE